MKDALVVLGDRDESGDLLREAAAYATGAESELVLYSPLSEEQFEDAVRTLDQIGRTENKDYSDEAATAVARQFAEDLADDALEEFDVTFSVVTDVTDELDASRVISLAEEKNCDHVFTLGKQLSPTGKAVFGDTTQQLLLNFPGFVTVGMN